MKSSRRKDGQFRSGGLLVGGRPFFLPSLPTSHARAAQASQVSFSSPDSFR
jgi:hypothetical protein